MGIVKPDAEITWISVTAAPLLLEKYGVVVTYGDISTRKRAEEALIKSEALFRGMFKDHSAVMLLIDPNTGQIVDANQAAAQYYGYPLENMIQMKIRQLNILSPAEIIEKMVGAFNKQVNIFEFRHLLADGQVRDVEVHSAPITIQNQILLFSIIHDITERIQAEAALKSAHIQLLALFDGIEDIIYVSDIETHELLYANEAFRKQWGDDSIGKKCYKIIQRLESPCPFCTNESISGPNFGNGLVWEHWNQATQRWYRCADKAIRWHDGREVRFELAIDITDRKQVEQERLQLEQRLYQVQKSESLGRMAGAIAHHFNNQLYAVIGNLEMAMDDLPPGVNSNESLVSAMQAAHKAAEVSRMMLTYLGQTPGKHEPIDLSEAYRQSLTFLQAASPKGMILNADFPSSGPIINADAGQMQQILTNLVTNAWESITDNRGAIGLTVKTVSHEDIPTFKRFPIDWQPQEIAYACLEVSDTGCGISNKDIEKIFDPFFTTKFTGRGLGLPVVMGIVKAHGGGVTVESEPGRGSIFRVFLPVSTEEVFFRPNPPAMPESQQTVAAEKLTRIESGGTVLLIEDEEPVRNMAKKMLIRLGYKVLEAKDGAEAVDIFQKHQDEIFFVLSDLTMPRMDGWDTLAALRNLSPDTPVILSSGYDEAKVMAEEHTEIPNAFLGKPYQLKGLRETINRVLTNMS